MISLNKARHLLHGGRVPVVAALAYGGLLLGLGACGDDPFTVNWFARPDTVILYSLQRPELNIASGFDFNNRIAVRIESPAATGSWDMALDTRAGELVLLPPGALGVTSAAGIASFPGAGFDDLIEAPSDTSLYVTRDPVPIELGTSYVVRSKETPDAFGRRCVQYYKVEPLEVDTEEGVLVFQFDGSGLCNSRQLIPPE